MESIGCILKRCQLVAYFKYNSTLCSDISLEPLWRRMSNTSKCHIYPQYCPIGAKTAFRRGNIFLYSYYYALIGALVVQVDIRRQELAKMFLYLVKVDGVAAVASIFI